MADAYFRLEQTGSVAHLICNRPEKANCMNAAFWTELPTIVRALDRDPSVRVLILSGEGRHFCAGMDLAAFDFIAELDDADPARAAFALRNEILRLQDAFNALEQARFPVIAAIHGLCIGGAIDMIAACDMRFCSQDSQFSIEEINVGMAADVGTLQRLPKLMPPGIVKELAYTGRRFGADEAKAWGFVNAVHADREATLAAAHHLAQQIAGKSPVAVAGIKFAIDYARDHSVADALGQIATWNGGMLRPADVVGTLAARRQSIDPAYQDLPEIREGESPRLPPRRGK